MTDITNYSILNRTPDLDTWKTFEGVRTRRIFAFFTDFVIVMALWVPAAVIVFFIGLFTFGLGFALYPILFFIVAVVAMIAYRIGDRRPA